jgi:hypothetical protein
MEIGEMNERLMALQMQKLALEERLQHMQQLKLMAQQGELIDEYAMEFKNVRGKEEHADSDDEKDSLLDADYEVSMDYDSNDDDNNADMGGRDETDDDDEFAGYARVQPRDEADKMDD